QNTVDLPPECIQRQLRCLRILQCNEITTIISVSQPRASLRFIHTYERRHRERDQFKARVLLYILQRYKDRAFLQHITEREVPSGRAVVTLRRKTEVCLAGPDAVICRLQLNIRKALR